jgi:hypothetical protein
MHMLQSGVDITLIALWLGHESPATTHMYVEADLAMKERALNAVQVWKYFHTRKNALFYRTLHGAQVGDQFMSLIHTCQLCGANSFDYLIELQRHARELAACPTEWMPWNYRETLARTASLPDSAELR